MALYEAVAQLRAALMEDPDPEFVHVFPTFGKEHEIRGHPGELCWCDPEPDHIDPRIIVHRSSH